MAFSLVYDENCYSVIGYQHMLTVEQQNTNAKGTVKLLRNKMQNNHQLINISK